MKGAQRGKPVYIVLYPGEPDALELCTRRYYSKSAAIKDAQNVQGAVVWKEKVDVVFGKHEGTAFMQSIIYK